MIGFDCDVKRAEEKGNHTVPPSTMQKGVLSTRESPTVAQVLVESLSLHGGFSIQLGIDL